MKNKNRFDEFISCLGNGKSIYQCESENYELDEILREMEVLE